MLGAACCRPHRAPHPQIRMRTACRVCCPPPGLRLGCQQESADPSDTNRCRDTRQDQKDCSSGTPCDVSVVVPGKFRAAQIVGELAFGCSSGSLNPRARLALRQCNTAGLLHRLGSVRPRLLPPPEVGRPAGLPGLRARTKVRRPTRSSRRHGRLGRRRTTNPIAEIGLELAGAPGLPYPWQTLNFSPLRHGHGEFLPSPDRSSALRNDNQASLITRWASSLHGTSK